MSTEESCVLGPREVRAAVVQEKMGGVPLTGPGYKARQVLGVARLQGPRDEDVRCVGQGCHMQRERVRFVSPFHTPPLHSKNVFSIVPPPGVSDVQGAVVGPGIPEEVESALSLLLYFTLWVVCGH